MIVTHTKHKDLAEHQQERYQELREHLKHWYAQPDLQCLRACAALYVGHFAKIDPIWMFVLGAPSTGKSEIMVNPLMQLPLAQSVSTITENSFISNYSEKLGILPNLETHDGQLSGVLLFSDFSNFLALDSRVRSGLQAQLREIYDGGYQKHCGARKESILWKGKISILAACTYELERYWSLEAALGDRFLTIKLIPPPASINMGIYMQRQNAQGMSKTKIRNKTRKLITAWVQGAIDSPTPDDSSLIDYLKLEALTHICLWLRQGVHRNGKGAITDVGERDGTSRFGQMIKNLGVQHARLFARDEMTEADWKLMQRVAFDTCPSRRLLVVQALLARKDMMLTQDEIYYGSLVGLIPLKALVYRVLEDLTALEIVVSEKRAKMRYYGLAPDFLAKLEVSDIRPLDIIPGSGYEVLAK